MENKVCISETLRKEVVNGRYEIHLVWHKNIWRYHIVVIDLRTYGLKLFREYTREQREHAYNYYNNFVNSCR